MAANWYVLRDGHTQYGPYDEEQLKEFAAAAHIGHNDMLWQEGTPQWVPASSVPGLLPASTTAAAPPPPVAATSPEVSGTRIAAGVLGIIFGSLGVHKFVLGMPGVGLTMLLISVLTCGIAAPVMHVIGIIEGIIYLTRSDQEFYRLYIIDKKSWF